MFDFLQKQGASAELSELLLELSAACARISKVIVDTSTGKAGTQNVFGEDQLALDVRAEEILQDHVNSCPFVATYCSEELFETMQGAKKCVNPDPKFSVFYDPLDGSSLVDVNMAVGTIVGVYEFENASTNNDIIGRTAREQVAALFAVYGPRTTLMMTIGKGVYEFTLVDETWEVTNEAVKMKGEDDSEKKKYFAPGNLRATKEREDYFNLVTEMMREQYTLRYSGGMVPDINHILKKGSGVFMYPGMPGAENGKLRLLYECGPMAMLMEQAGGMASAGRFDGDDKPILDLKITELVQRTPIFVGSTLEVQRCENELEVLT